MRALSPGTAAWANAEALTRAHVWRMTRRDALVFGFTDHDQPLTALGLDCEPSEGLTAGEIELSDDLSPDTASLRGALSSERISEADLAAGLWDGAKVEVFAVDWRDPSAYVSLFTGFLGEVSHKNGVFEAEIRGLQAGLNAPVGRSLSRRCDARLGDARCSVSLAGFTQAGVIDAVSADGAVSVSGLAPPTSEWFMHGEALFASGARRAIVEQRPLAGGGVEVRFSAPLPLGIIASQAVTLTAGCDKSAGQCGAKFANILNFQGFAYMPGNDVLTAGPHPGEPRDGASRFR